jgi:hypothetical protein
MPDKHESHDISYGRGQLDSLARVNAEADAKIRTGQNDLAYPCLDVQWFVVFPYPDPSMPPGPRLEVHYKMRDTDPANVSEHVVCLGL